MAEVAFGMEAPARVKGDDRVGSHLRGVGSRVAADREHMIHLRGHLRETTACP